MMERSRSKLVVNVLARFIGGLAILLALVLVPAGTFAFWEVWLYALTLAVPMSIALIWLFRKDQALLERRLQAREQQKVQKWIMALGSVSFAVVFIVCGYDERWNWSTVSTRVVLFADAIMLLSYLAIFAVLRINRYAARTIRVEAGQQLVSTGPYAVIRHPMYAAALVFYLVTPIGLGSWWGVLAAAPMVAVFMARILNEEEVLSQELPGYREYMQVTRYRLIPRIW